ncbi:MULTISPECIES: septal ring lytic transglycosylase RlpA family protein [Ochrobactrum]|uniref:Endolytic peptidoglycan transglycosylase RlpA n=1 Tax=Ochrobactrum chromiisoli TaxID=2993941 RepID=A0ABT3QNN5_9HYPH|nr:septal ring lytic transglycosylase RlpA family protein [Ochrobactrum chromiisoli]MCX2697215.1 septal ring lytic transglycosylase RlpA family protein [Ochrobactrum chromiisoli]
MSSNGWRNRAESAELSIRRDKRAPAAMLTFVALALALAGCASAPQPKSKKKHPKEYFAESKYGVKASPRVTSVQGKPLPRGGGRDQIGKPYQVKGRWYYPKENKNYASTGRASWYGSAFHGRLTANGEIYDMTHLTAAHPTMPLPSYARVTNMYNGSSIIVRVNDRGPFERDRVIDLSQKAAEMLDYQHHGTADVKVEYVGRAPLDGQDDAYLMASYRPGNADPIGQPATGVMMAMNAPTPTPAGIAAMPIPQSSPFEVNQAYGDGDMPLLPASVPVPSQRPAHSFGVATAANIGGLGYASDRLAASAYAEERTYGSILTESAISNAWKRKDAEEPREYVELGTFNTLEDALKLQKSLPRSARVTRTKTPTEQGDVYELTAFAQNGNNDDLLRAAWKAGASDAFVVRAD